jgi:hypothetical protein
MRKSQIIREQRKNIALALSNSPDGLLAPLNRVPQSKRGRRLLELVRALQDIEHEEAVLNEVDRQLSEDPNYETAGPVRAPSHMYARANEILSSCYWSPRVLPPPHESHSFTWKARTVQSDWENRFVFWVLNLRTRGDISLIRSCRNCGQWFYAVTNHQSHCSDRCRQQFHSRDRSFKEKRRLYMRRYRKDEKSQNSAATQLIRKGRRSAEAKPPRATRLRTTGKGQPNGGLQTDQGL